MGKTHAPVLAYPLGWYKNTTTFVRKHYKLRCFWKNKKSQSPFAPSNNMQWLEWGVPHPPHHAVTGIPPRRVSSRHVLCIPQSLTAFRKLGHNSFIGIHALWRSEMSRQKFHWAPSSPRWRSWQVTNSNCINGSFSFLKIMDTEFSGIHRWTF